MTKKHNRHNLDYPYLSLPDIDEDEIDNSEYPLWEQNLEKEIQGLNDK